MCCHPISPARAGFRSDPLAPSLRMCPAAIPLTKDQNSRPWLVIFDAAYRGQSGRYAIPIRIRWDRLDRRNYDAKNLAAVRQGSREGTLIDAAYEGDLIAGIIDDLRHCATFEEGQLRLAYIPTERLASIAEEPIENVRAVQTEQSNSTALVDQKFVVKLYRTLENGINPEVEVGTLPDGRCWICQYARSAWQRGVDGT